jgi:hypothetical protein
MGLFDTTDESGAIYGGGGNTIDKLIEMIRGQRKSNPIADAGSVLGAFSQGEKANRVVGANMQGDFDRLMVDREADMNRLALDAQEGRNLNETDAMRKLQQTAYMRGGGSNFAPPTISLGGQDRTAPSFAGIAPRGMSGEEMQGATDLQGQVMDRLKPGGSVTMKWEHKPTAPQTKPGMMENIGSYGGAALGVLGSLGEMFGPGAGTGTVMNSVGGAIGKLGGGTVGNMLGKAAPAAGAAMGTYGLFKEDGIGNNLKNGAMAGAGIGSMVAPGIGTAIGAGIGAGAGALKSAFGGGPSEQELAGRQTASMARQTISSGATPQQMQEAKASGWSNPQDALAMIVIRDKVAANGGSPEQANQLMSMLFQAEKGGPQAVEQAIQQIMQAVGGQPRV